jgi:hypothetical protein
MALMEVKVDSTISIAVGHQHRRSGVGFIHAAARQQLSFDIALFSSQPQPFQTGNILRKRRNGRDLVRLEYQSANRVRAGGQKPQGDQQQERPPDGSQWLQKVHRSIGGLHR